MLFAPFGEVFVGDGLLLQEADGGGHFGDAVLGEGLGDPLVDHVIVGAGVGVGVVAHPGKVGLDAVLLEGIKSVGVIAAFIGNAFQAHGLRAEIEAACRFGEAGMTTVLFGVQVFLHGGIVCVE